LDPGIRNFLTLFLSIEVSKAMRQVAEAKEAGDDEGQSYAQTMVDYFTRQLDEANPILTQISDAMTEEGSCKEKLQLAIDRGDADDAATWEAKMTAAAETKLQGNHKLMECSARYNKMMKDHREMRGHS
jgi:S-formylglutathione hydrolase FrmB